MAFQRTGKVEILDSRPIQGRYTFIILGQVDVASGSLSPLTVGLGGRGPPGGDVQLGHVHLVAEAGAAVVAAGVGVVAVQARHGQGAVLLPVRVPARRRGGERGRKI